MKIGSNKEVNKSTSLKPDKTEGKVKEDHLMDKSRMLTEQHNDEKIIVKLLIVGAGLIAYHFW